MSEKVSPEIEALLKEDRSFAPSDEFRSRALVNDPAIYAKAAKDPEAFWAGFAKELEWITPWSKVLEWNAPDAKWFVGGKINIAPTVSIGTSAPRGATRPRSSGKASPAIAAR